MKQWKTLIVFITHSVIIITRLISIESQPKKIIVVVVIGVVIVAVHVLVVVILVVDPRNLLL